MASSRLIEAIAVTAELCGRTFTPAAAKLLADDLSTYDEQPVLRALSRCRKELKPGQFCLEAITSRIDDGRPGPEEAWAMLPHDEYKTVVWTDEMVAAWSVALPLIEEGEMVSARMAFKEAYTKAITEAREQRIPVKWSASLGHDKNGREAALLDAVEKGRLSAPQVKTLLPYHEITQQTKNLLERLDVGMLPA
jgi:hypothetical protein